MEEARTIGGRIRQIRKVRDKSQAVIAGLAGISTATLSRIEAGTHALDSLTLIVALAGALEVPPRSSPSCRYPRPPTGTRIPPLRRSGWRWTPSTSTNPAGW